MTNQSRQCSFGDIQSKKWSYRLSTRNFVIRLSPGISGIYFFKRFLSHHQLQEKFYITSAFPHVNTYVLGINRDNYEYLSELKTLLRENMQKDIRFAGALYVNEASNLYQIYTGNLYLKFHDDVKSQEIKQFFTRRGLKVEKSLNFAENSFFIKPETDPGKEIFDFSTELLGSSMVHYCHPELVRRHPEKNKFAVSGGIQKGGFPWHFDRISLKKAWDYTRGKGSVIAIIDDGIELSHPAFLGRLFKPGNFTGTGADDPSHRFAFEGHGTKCASVAAAYSDHVPGVAPEARLMPVRYLGLGSFQEAQAIHYAALNGADVISCSWGPPDSNPVSDDKTSSYTPLPAHTRLAIDFAVKKGRMGKGCPVVFSSGNGDESLINDGYSHYKNVLSVGAVNESGKKSLYSDFGPSLLCVFPSSDLQQKPDGSWQEKSLIPCASRIKNTGPPYSAIGGTSASAAGVAGVIALINAINPELTLSQIRDILIKSCRDVPDMKANPLFYGHGIPDAYLAVSLAKKNITQKSRIMNNAVSLHIGVNYVDPQFYGNLVRPLNGCINDMNRMKELAESFGFQPIAILPNEKASLENIRASIMQAAEDLKEGDIFLITFAGHGSQIRDADGDEKDGYDETWLTYNGFMIDDERNELFSRFRFGVRILVISDSCHSGTSTRALSFQSPKKGSRWVSAPVSMAVLERNGIQPPRFTSAEVKASVKLLAACDDHQEALEENGNGIFTSRLIEVAENFQGNYSGLVAEIRKNMPPHQTPVMYDTGKKNTAFNSQKAFDIRPAEQLDEIGDPGKVQNEMKTMPVSEKLILEESRNNKFELKDNSVISSAEGLTSSMQFEGKTPWDKAYHAWFSMKKNPGYIEPDIVSRVNVEGQGSDEVKSRHLETYPIPAKNIFSWHLDSEHSRLKEARELVYPSLSIGFDPPKVKNVRIAHIDTGVLPGHRMDLPVNFNFRLSRAFQDFWNDKSYEDEQKTIGDTHAHGHGTVSILAGNKIEISDHNGYFHDYFGAIPFADVVSLKISETVVNLSGHRFAKALRYAVDNKCEVVTMSMAGIPSHAMASAVNYAYEKGVFIVTAAGNSWEKGFKKIAPKRLLYPARFERVVAAVGATYDHTPYLFDLNNKKTRASGGLYMQMNYGPPKAMKTAIAGYTPNVVWFHEDKKHPGEYYTTTGGGTSSATPQIAAAAGLYLQKYRDEIEALISEPWEKVEIIRKALWKSARKPKDEYAEYFGQGLLDARAMLGLKPADLFNDREGIKKSAPARSAHSLIGKLFNVYSSRSADQKNSLVEMLSQELTQLMYLDPELEEFTSYELDEDFEEADWNRLAEKARNSAFASEFLKRSLKSTYKSDDCGNRAPGSGQHNMNLSLETKEFGEIHIVSPNITGQAVIKENVELPEGFGKEDYCEIEIDFEDDFIPARSSFVPEVEIYTDIFDEEDGMAMLLEQEDENGEPLYQWVLEELNESKGRSTNSQVFGDKPYFSFGLQMKSQDNTPDSRGLIRKAGKAVVKLFRLKKLKALAKKELVEQVSKLDDRKYEHLVYDLDKKVKTRKEANNSWKKIEKDDPLWKDIKKQKKLLFVFPGLFGSVNGGYDDFLSNSLMVESLKATYGRYIIGFNMPDVFSGISENAEKFVEGIPSGISGKIDVFARSRGSVVARTVFESKAKGTVLEGKLDKFVMFGPPNQGTPMACEENWKPLLDITTNVVFRTFSNLNPVAKGLISLLKAILLQIPQLPGVEDLSDGNPFITELNSTRRVNRDNYYVVVSNFEPVRLKALFDNLIVDRKLFHGEKNDTVVPVAGAVGLRVQSHFTIKPENQLILADEQNTNHFKYLRNEKVLAQLFDWGILKKV